MWRKGGPWSSIWVSKGQREQREHVASGSRGYNFSKVGLAQKGTHVGHLVLPYPEPTGPFMMERGQSPSLGGPSLLNPVD